MPEPVLALTPGDPQGIGPEITTKFLANHLARFSACRFQVVGSYQALQNSANLLGLALPKTGQVDYTDIPSDKPGAVAYQAIETAVDLLARRDAQALVTGPISKENLHRAGYAFGGHTEILEALARQHGASPKTKAEMLFVYRNFRMLLLTRHIPLGMVPIQLRSPLTQTAFQTLAAHLVNDCGIAHPKVAVLGVNPHAGEIGGDEESEILQPLMEDLNEAGPAIFEGPFPADGFFRGFDPGQYGYDACIVAYHDQGLIPFKLIAGYEAVNVTIGLPFIRTSVSHGTAPDIVGKGIASEASLVAAVEAALGLVASRSGTL